MESAILSVIPSAAAFVASKPVAASPKEEIAPEITIASLIVRPMSDCTNPFAEEMPFISL